MVRSLLAGRAGAVTLGLAADRILGEPPAAVHPVAHFGRAMEGMEGALWADRRRSGILYAASGLALAAGAGAVLAKGGRPALAAATFVAVAGRALCEAAAEVDRALEEGDLPHARHLLRNLVGRETDHLDEPEVVRAAVESVAENTVDAVTAPLLWALAGGTAGVLAYRAVNTLDAMVGHHSDRYERFGWASARADDAANWIPARLTAVAVAAVRPRRAGAVIHAVRRQAGAHPSPNAGVVEAAFAAALGVTLGGVNDYAGRTEARPPLGSGAGPQRRHIAAACRLSRHATAALGVSMLAATSATGPA